MTFVESQAAGLALGRRLAARAGSGQKVIVGGVALTTQSRADLTEQMVADCRMASLKKTAPRLVFDLNGQGLSLQATDPEYRQALERADIVHADGGFLVTVARFLAGKPIGGRSATTDLMADMAERAAAEGLSFYLLGGSEALNVQCAKILKDRYPGLRIAGRHHGYFTIEEEATVVAAIREAKPDIIWVGMGKPREQVFCLRYRKQLQAGWMVTCGGCFNFITGHYRRAPLWMQNANLEWLHRMLTNPRLFWRYVLTTPHAFFLALSRTPVGQGQGYSHDDV